MNKRIFNRLAAKAPPLKESISSIPLLLLFSGTLLLSGCLDSSSSSSNKGCALCHQDAECLFIDGSAQCHCRDGFEGDGVTCTPLDPCSSGDHDCHPEASCSVSEEGVQCTCNAGFQGDGHTCSPIAGSPCDPGNHDCHVNAHCASHPGSDPPYSCTCQEGYEGDGRTCTPTSESGPCASGSHDCHVNAACIPDPESDPPYSCTCQEGYEGDGRTCTPTSENGPCASGAHDCHANADCIPDPEPGADPPYSCLCQEGYEGDGHSCHSTDECATEAHNCSPDALCTYSDGEFHCECKEGFEGNGITCTPIDDSTDCATECHHRARCVETEEGPQCQCLPGYRGNGISSCTDIDECAEGLDNCHELATCTNTTGTFLCTCPPENPGNGVECAPHASSCLELLDLGLASGEYKIELGGLDPFSVYCDMTTDGGGWTMVQRTVWSWEESSALWTGYSPFYNTTIGSLESGKAYRLAAKLWPLLGESGDHLMVHQARQASNGASCLPLYYKANGQWNLTVAGPGEIRDVVQNVTIFNGTDVSTTNTGPSTHCTAINQAVPWTYTSCCSTCPTYKSGYWTDAPHPMANYLATPDLFGKTHSDQCSSPPITSSSYYGMNAMTYYIR